VSDKPAAWRRGCAGDGNRDRLGLLVVIETMKVKKIKLGKNRVEK
jgi:hypothetical protein